MRAENFSCVFLLNRPRKCEKTPYFAFLTTGKGLKWHFKYFTPKLAQKNSFSHFNPFPVVKTRKEWSKSILWPQKPHRLKNNFQDWMETRRATAKINFKNPKSKVGFMVFGVKWYFWSKNGKKTPFKAPKSKNNHFFHPKGSKIDDLAYFFFLVMKKFFWPQNFEKKFFFRKNLKNVDF